MGMPSPLCVLAPLPKEGGGGGGGEGGSAPLQASMQLSKVVPMASLILLKAIVGYQV